MTTALPPVSPSPLAPLSAEEEAAQAAAQLVALTAKGISVANPRNIASGCHAALRSSLSQVLSPQQFPTNRTNAGSNGAPPPPTMREQKGDS